MHAFCFQICVYSFAQHVCVLLLSDCVRYRGLGYRGAEQRSSTGLTCLNWANTTRDYDAEVHPDSQTGEKADLFFFNKMEKGLLIFESELQSSLKIPQMLMVAVYQIAPMLC